MAHLCPICKSSLHHAAPARENDDVPLGEVPEHLRDHQCCGTKCGHLLHKVCFCRELLGKSIPKCPVCSKELVIGEVNPLTLPPHPRKPPSEKPRWVQYPKPASDSVLPHDFFKECSKFDKRPAFLVLNQTSSLTFYPTKEDPPPTTPKESRAERPLNTHLMILDDVVVYFLQNDFPETLQDIISRALRPTKNKDKALKTQITTFVEKMNSLEFSKGFHAFQILPGVVKWLLSLDTEVARKGIETWNGLLDDHFTKQNFEEGLDDNYKTHLFASLPELLAASQNIGAVDFFRLMLLYKDLNRDGRLDAMKSKVERILMLHASQPVYQYSFNASSAEVREGVANVVAVMENIVEWMMEQGFLEQSLSSSASQT